MGVTVGRLFSRGVVVFWVVMMALLVRQEVMPGLRMGSPANYRSVLGRQPERKTVRMGIYAFDRRLGTTVSTVTPRRDGSIQITNRTDLSLGFLAEKGARLTPLTTVKSRSELRLSPSYRLETFLMTVTSPLFSIEMRGVVDGEELLFTFRSGEHTHTSRIPFDAEMPLTETIGPMWSAGNLRVGRQWEVNVLDPRDLTLTQALVQVVGEGRREWRGETVRTYRLLVTYQGNAMEAEVTQDGELLRQTINWPLRLTLIREEAEDQAEGRSPR